MPFKGAIIVALVLLGFEEFFPFSHFPMYSTLPPYTDYLYLTDSAGQVIAQEAVFGVRSARMKKIFNTHVRAAVKPGEKPSPEAWKWLVEKPWPI